MPQGPLPMPQDPHFMPQGPLLMPDRAASSRKTPFARGSGTSTEV